MAVWQDVAAVRAADALAAWLGRHDGRTIDDTADSDGAAFKLRDEFDGRYAHRDNVRRRFREGLGGATWWEFFRPLPGRHRAPDTDAVPRRPRPRP